MYCNKEKLYLIEISSEHTKRLRPVRVLAQSYEEAVESLGMKPFESVKKHREMKGLERFLEDMLCPRPKESVISQNFHKIVRLLKVNTPIDTAFKMQLSTVKHWKSRYIYQKLINSISTGDSLTKAFSRQGKVFSSAFLTMLRSAEKSSEVPNVLLKIGINAQRSERIRKKLVGEMIYPSIVLTSVGIAFLMLIFVFLPQVKGIYDDLGAKMPAITEVLYSFSLGVRSHPIVSSTILIFGLIGLWRGGKRYIRTRLYESMLYKIPRLGPFLLNRNIITTLEYLSMMQASNVAIEEALKMASEVTSSRQIQGVCISVRDSVSKGKSLSEAFWCQHHLLGRHASEIINAIEIGERSGDVEDNLKALLEGLQEEQENEVNNFGKILGPIVTLFLAAVACIVVLTFLLPLVQITEAFTKGAGLGS